MVYKYTVPLKPISAMETGPGPIYSLPSIFDQAKSKTNSKLFKSPSWKIGERCSRNIHNTDSPGPKYFVEPSVLKNGKAASLRFSIRSKATKVTEPVTPGPDLYFSENSSKFISTQKNAPCHALRFKTNNFKVDNNPAPNAYRIRSFLGKSRVGNERSAPAFSIRSRSEVGMFNEDLQKTPGSNYYNVPESNKYKRKSPSYSLHSRTILTSDNVAKPGPGAYNIDQPRQQSSISYSFGLKHSLYSGHFVLEPNP